MKIGIAIASSTAADTLRRVVALQRDHQVAWVAANGDETLHRCESDRPDLVLIDLSMAVVDAGRVTRGIAGDGRCAVLVLADSVAARAASVFDAMGYGALDAADMPSCDPACLIATAAMLVAKMETIARLIGASGMPHRRSSVATVASPTSPLVLVIGASAGGPAAIASVLLGIPTGFPGAIVVVQHVHSAFVSGMADWLSERSGHAVAIAREGDRLSGGRVLLAGAEGHLILQRGGRLAYCAEPQHTAYQPSVDVFFQSVSRHWHGDVIGVLLTGMGKDGAVGLRALRDGGHYTIAQDQATSAVYGMPKAAAALEAAVAILPVDGIAARVLEIARR
jgi:two-component system, chemotaxis family, response regulator WspF